MATNDQAWTAACERAACMAQNNISINAGLISAAIEAELERHGLQVELVPAPAVRAQAEPFNLTRKVGPTAAREQLRKREVRRAG